MTWTQPAEAIEVARDPRRWSHWPLLPLKRNQTGAVMFDEGCLVDGSIVEPVVYRVILTNVFMPALGAPCLVYDSLDAVFADGWVVD